MADMVNHPKHYTSHPSGIEVIQITEHMTFNLGNAIKYIMRSELKGKQLEDLDKAIWYIQREKQRILKEQGAELPVTDVRADGLVITPDTKIYATGISGKFVGDWTSTNSAGLDIADKYPNYRKDDSGS